MPPVIGGLKREGAPFNGENEEEEMRWLFPLAEVAEGGHGGGLRSVMVAAVPALLGWRWKKAAGGAGWAKRQSGPAGSWADWARSWKKSFQNKNWIFEFTMALEICTRRFRRNLVTRIFPKVF
jgi:hypothetical protein